MLKIHDGGEKRRKAMKHKKIKRSTFLPLAFLVYLAFMAYIGRGYFYSGEYLRYFGTIGVSLVVIILLRWALKRREFLQKQREDEQQYGPYKIEDEAKNDNDNKTQE